MHTEPDKSNSFKSVPKPPLIIGDARYLRTSDSAAYLGIGKSTLERKRVEGTGPKFRQLGSRIVVYAIKDLDAWASEQVLNSTSERVAA